MALKVRAVDKALAGSSIDIRVDLNLENPVKMQWGGISLILERPCERDFPVVTNEMFSEGSFESGSFVRRRSLTISPRVLPSIPNRGITYQVRTDVSFQEPGNDATIDLLDEKPIEISMSPPETPRAHPVNISLKGLDVKLKQDVFNQGAQIKIDLIAAEIIKTLQVKLIHDANVICKCPSFAIICTHMHRGPPKILASAELEGVRTESIMLKIPETAEESHSYTWQPSEQIGWYHSVEDHSNYYIDIEGRNMFNEVIQVSIPIRVLRPLEAKWEEPLLIQPEQEAEPRPYFPRKPPKRVNIIGHTIDGDCLLLNARNVTDRTLEGITIKIAGLVEELFERSPQMIGIAKWEQNEEKCLKYEKYSNEITEYQITIEDNEGYPGTQKYSLKT